MSHVVAARDELTLRHSDLVNDSETSDQPAELLVTPCFTRGRITFKGAFLVKAEVIKVNLNAVFSGKISIKT